MAAHPAGAARRLARGVKAREQFLAARDLGFTLFQCPFFKEPEVLRDRPLGSNEVARLNLFRLMEAEELDVKILSEAIRSEVSIRFRLFSYLNSAWFGFRHNIQSIDQAVVLLGWVKLKSWPRAVLFLDLVPAGRLFDGGGRGQALIGELSKKMVYQSIPEFFGQDLPYGFEAYPVLRPARDGETSPGPD